MSLLNRFILTITRVRRMRQHLGLLRWDGTPGRWAHRPDDNSWWRAEGRSSRGHQAETYWRTGYENASHL